MMKLEAVLSSSGIGTSVVVAALSSTLRSVLVVSRSCSRREIRELIEEARQVASFCD